MKAGTIFSLIAAAAGVVIISKSLGKLKDLTILPSILHYIKNPGRQSQDTEGSTIQNFRLDLAIGNPNKTTDFIFDGIQAIVNFEGRKISTIDLNQPDTIVRNLTNVVPVKFEVDQSALSDDIWNALKAGKPVGKTINITGKIIVHTAMSKEIEYPLNKIIKV